MRTPATAVVVGASAAILTAGIVAAPDPAATAGTDPQDPTASATDSDTPDTATPGGQGSGVTGTFDGPVVENIRGDYQASLTFEDGVLVGVEFPVAGTDAPESRFVNERSLPVLEEEMIAAQSWDVEYVSGASYTSPAMIESAQAAFEDAGL